MSADRCDVLHNECPSAFALFIIHFLDVPCVGIYQRKLALRVVLVGHKVGVTLRARLFDHHIASLECISLSAGEGFNAVHYERRHANHLNYTLYEWSHLLRKLAVGTTEAICFLNNLLFCQDRWTDGEMDIWDDGWIDGRINGWLDGEMARWGDGEIDRWIDWEVDK